LPLGVPKSLRLESRLLLLLLLLKGALGLMMVLLLLLLLSGSLRVVPCCDVAEPADVGRWVRLTCASYRREKRGGWSNCVECLLLLLQLLLLLRCPADGGGRSAVPSCWRRVLPAWRPRVAALTLEEEDGAARDLPSVGESSQAWSSGWEEGVNLPVT
jgi:hypothetical protein